MSSSLSDSSMNGPLIAALAGAEDLAGFDTFPFSASALGESTLLRFEEEPFSLYHWSSFKKSSPSPQISSGVRDRGRSVVSTFTAACSILASPFLSSRNSPFAVSFPTLFPRCVDGVPPPLLGERDDVTNWVIRDWDEVAPAGPSVFWKKFKMLLFRFAEDDDLALEGPLEGVEPFRAFGPVMTCGAKSAREQRSVPM